MMELSNPWLAYLLVFAAGLISSASPCVLVIIPLIIGYVGGYADGDVKRSISYSLLFSLGIAITFTLLGALASVTGTLLGDIGGFWKYILSAVAILMGLQMWGALNLTLPQVRLKAIGPKGGLGAFLLGLLFGIALSPCATPVLAVILTYVASRKNMLYGISLLFVYSLAHSVLILLVGIFTGVGEKIIRSRYLPYIHKLSGVLFILFGLFILWSMR